VVLVVGATSGIGAALCRELARNGWDLVLGVRDVAEGSVQASDVRIRWGTAAAVVGFEAQQMDGVEALLAECSALAGGRLAGVVVCHGLMEDQREAEGDAALARRMIDVNFTSAALVCGCAAAAMAEAGSGFVCGVSSVAGDRGRQSNYIYGAAKAGLSAFLQGLRNRVWRCGVRVITVKPGFVDTRMTWGLLKPGSPLMATPERVARDIVRAIDRGKDVVYTPWFWRWIMLVIRAIPETVFKRMRL
jgi:short-subunit dehydrogenase